MKLLTFRQLRKPTVGSLFHEMRKGNPGYEPVTELLLKSSDPGNGPHFQFRKKPFARWMKCTAIVDIQIPSVFLGSLQNEQCNNQDAFLLLPVFCL